VRQTSPIGCGVQSASCGGEVAKGYRGQTCAEAIKSCFTGRAVLAASVIFKEVQAQGDWAAGHIWLSLVSLVENLPPARHRWPAADPFLFLRPDGQYEMYHAKRRPKVVP
jgi:hypothetical protein